MGHLQEVGIEQKDSQAYPICQAVQGPPAAPYGRALGFHPTLTWCHSQGRGGGGPFHSPPNTAALQPGKLGCPVSSLSVLPHPLGILPLSWVVLVGVQALLWRNPAFLQVREWQFPSDRPRASWKPLG